MGLTDDLGPEALARALPGRPVRSYPALLSTEADALAWGRAGGPQGAVVAAGHQAAPRGRLGIEWDLRDRAFAFSVILRPSLAVEREGWLYVVASTGLADALPGRVSVDWPDEAWSGDRRLGAVAAHAILGPRSLDWAVVSVLVSDPVGPRADVLASVVTAIEARLAEPPDAVLDAYRPRCRTLERRVLARLMPLGATGKRIVGRAAAVLKDGALVIERDDGRRLLVRPQELGFLEDPADEDGGPASRPPVPGPPA